MKDASAPSAPQPRTVRRATQGPQALMPLPCKKGEGLQYNNFKCPECQTQFSSKTEMVTHFQQIRGAPNSVSMDRVSQHPPVCVCVGGAVVETALHSFLSPDVYAVLASHDAAQPVRRLRPPEDPQTQGAARVSRVWRRGPPGQLPDPPGGGLPALCPAHRLQVWGSFQPCFGSGPSVSCPLSWSRCSSCQVVFGGLNSIKSHIQTAHCEVFHKCPSCPMAFKSSPSAQSHISTQHPTLTGGQAK